MSNRYNHLLTIKRLIGYNYYHISKLVLAILMLILASIFEVICPMIIGYFIDNILPKKIISLKIFLFLISSFIILQILSAILRYYQLIIFHKIALKIVYKIRKEIMKSILYQPLFMFDQNSTGQLISRITNDTEAIKDLYVVVITSVLRSIALIFFMLCSMFILDARLACISLILLPIVSIIMYLYQKYSMPIVKILRSNIANINSIFNEAISGMEVIQIFCQKEKFRNNLYNIGINYLNAKMKNIKFDGYLLRPLLSLIFLLTLCVIIIMFGIIYQESISIGILYIFINYFGRLNEPLIELASQQSIIQQAIVSGSRVFEIIDKPYQNYGNDISDLKTGLIEIKNLSFYYKKNFKVLKNINIKIPDKSFTAIIGKTGSGKSTIANLIMGHYPIKIGDIIIDGRSINSINKHILRKNLAIVQQDPVIMTETVYFNITLGRKISEDKIWDALKKVNLESLIRKLPKGLYTELGEQGNILSAGQKQLLSLARILVFTPLIIILDEATANIDYKTENIILSILNLINKNSTIIAIAHRLSTIKNASNIFVLNKGEIVENGNHDTLINMKGYYYNMYNLQKRFQSLSKNYKI